MTDPITRLNAALEGRYRLERQIGEGGMATVYLAEYLRHERKVRYVALGRLVRTTLEPGGVRLGAGPVVPRLIGGPALRQLRSPGAELPNRQVIIKQRVHKGRLWSARPCPSRSYPSTTSAWRVISETSSGRFTPYGDHDGGWGGVAWTVVVRSASDLALDLTSQYAGREDDLLMQGSNVRLDPRQWGRRQT